MASSNSNDRKARDPRSIDTFEFNKSMRKLDKKLRSCRKLNQAFNHVQEFYELVKRYILFFKCDYDTFAERHTILFQVFENRIERWILEDVIGQVSHQHLIDKSDRKVASSKLI